MVTLEEISESLKGKLKDTSIYPHVKMDIIVQQRFLGTINDASWRTWLESPSEESVT